ncbi:hypothetical protein [Pseudonocardia sp. HH130630-07]|uniref:hypothetical protein n=1 Tax=Pseudonocardia sp. HH130630-07 TaxID=1690815 RepID=UPI001E3434F5|nr:hypothetical protein [Pseudonocardia sp. HH130630-07]
MVNPTPSSATVVRARPNSGRVRNVFPSPSTVTSGAPPGTGGGVARTCRCPATACASSPEIPGSRTHAASDPSSRGTRGGAAVRQASCAQSQRSANAQVPPTSSARGTLPGIETSRSA